MDELAKEVKSQNASLAAINVRSGCRAVCSPNSALERAARLPCCRLPCALCPLLPCRVTRCSARPAFAPCNRRPPPTKASVLTLCPWAPPRLQVNLATLAPLLDNTVVGNLVSLSTNADSLLSLAPKANALLGLLTIG